MANIDISFLTPEGNLAKDRLVLGSILISLADEPELLAKVAPLDGRTSRLLTWECLGSCSTKKNILFKLKYLFSISAEARNADFLYNTVLKSVNESTRCESTAGMAVTLPEPEKTIDDSVLLYGLAAKPPIKDTDVSL